MATNQREFPGFGFQVDLMKLNLNLGDAEHVSETHTRAYANALDQIRTLDTQNR